ncbi:putative uncharacterized protein DDB_G0282133 isoform X2 [Cimex lectularius]|uniref:Uncharacterized protein n=1 Tax=Cimex lectularius TaxID=79782 RepID=A0A8I6RIK5_CIMLE|nr:putative uncharacterized protein DDB_G0282133 isoform X2 [Cimex lectularius]
MIGPFVVPKPCIPSIPAPCYFPPCCPVPCTPCPPKCPPVVCPPKCPPKCPPPPCPSPNQTALTRTTQFQLPSGSSNGKNTFLNRSKLNSICAYNVVGTKPKLTLGNVKVMKKFEPRKNAADNSTNAKKGITCETVVTSKGRVTVCKWDNEELNDPHDEENLYSNNHVKNYKVRPSKSDSMLAQAKNHNFKCLTYEIKDPITKINKKSKICFENGHDIVNYLSKGVQTQLVLPLKLTKNSPVHNEPKHRFSCKNNKPQINKNTSPIRKSIEPQKKEKTWYSHHRMDSVETQTNRSYNPQKNRSFPLPAKTIRKRYIYVPKYIRNKGNLNEIMNMENKSHSLNSDKMKPNVDYLTDINKINIDGNIERIPRTVSTGMNTDISKITRTVCTYTNENDCANKKSSNPSVGLNLRESNSVYKINITTSAIKEKESNIPVKKNKSSMQMQRINSQMNKEKEKYVVKMCGTDPITKVSKGTQMYFQKIDKVPSKTLIPNVVFEPPAEQRENENPLLNTINGINNYILDYLKPKGVNENKGDQKSRSKSMHKIQFECSLNDSGKPHCYAVHRNLSPTSEITLPSVVTPEHTIKNQINKNEANKKFGNIICQHFIHKDLNENFIHPNSNENIVNLINDLNTRKDSKKSLKDDVLLETNIIDGKKDDVLLETNTIDGKKDDVLLETNTTDGKLKENNATSLCKPHDTVKFCCPGCSSDYQCCKETTQHNKNEEKNTDEDSAKLKEKKLSSGMDNICVNVDDITKKQLSLYTACCSKNKKEENRPSVDSTLYKNGQKFRLGNKATNTCSGCSILPAKKVNRGCSAFDVSPKTNTSTSMSQNDMFPKENVQPINENKPNNKIFDTLDFTDGLTHLFLKYLNQNARRLVFDRINQDNSISSIEDIMENILNSAFVVKTKVQKSKKLKKESNAYKRKRKLLKIKAKLKQQKSRNTSKESTDFNQSIQSIKQSSAELNKEHRIKLAECNSHQSSNNKEVVAKILTKNESPKENKSDFIQNVSKQQALCETEIIKTLSEMTIRSSKKTIQSNVSQPNSSTNKFSNNRRSQIKLITSLQQLYGKHLSSDQKKREKSKISSSNDKTLKEKIKREDTEHEAAKLENTPKPETSNLNTNATNLSENINMYYSSQKECLSMDQNSVTDYDKKQIETFSFNSQNVSNNEKLPDRGQSDYISEHIFGRTKPNYFFNNILDHLLSSNKPSLNEFNRDESSDNCQFSIADGKTCDEDIQLSIQKLESYGETADLKSKVSIETEKGDKGISIENNKTQTNVISHDNVPVHNVGHKDWHSPQMPGAFKKNETLTTFTERNICSQRYLTDTTKTCQDDIRKIDVLVKKQKTEGLEHRKNKHDEKIQINTNFAEVSNENDYFINKTHNIVDAKIQYVRNVNAGHKNWCNNITTKKRDEDLDQKPAVVTEKKTLNNNESMAPTLSQENIKSSKSIISNDNKTKESDTQSGIQSSSKPQKSSPTTPFNHSKEVPVNSKISIEDKLTIKIDNLEKDILNSSYLQLGANSTLVNPGNNDNTQTSSYKQSNTLSENTSQKKVTDRESPLSEKRQLDRPSESSFQNRTSPPLQNDYDSELYLTPWVLGVPYNTAKPYKNEDLNDKDAMTNINVTKYHDKNSIQNTDIVNTGDCTTGMTGFTNTNKNDIKQSNIVHETTKITEIIYNDRDKTKHTNIEEADKHEMAKINELKDNDKFSKQTNNSNEKDDYEISTIGKVKTTNIVTNNSGSNTDMLNITEVNTNTGKDNTKEKTIANDTDEYKTAGMTENKLTAKEEFLNIDNVSDKMESKYPSTDKITIHSTDIMNFHQGVTENENSTTKNNNSTSDTNQDHLKTNEIENDLKETNQSYNHEIDCEICNQYKNDLKFTFKHNKDQSGKDSIKSPDIQPCIPEEKLMLKQPSSVGSYERLGDKSNHFLEQITAALEAECKKQAEQNSNKYKHKFKEFHYNRKRQENDKQENVLLKTFNKNRLNPHQNKTNDTLKQLNIDVLHRQENNTIINQVITSTKKTPQIFIKENKDLVACEPKSQIKEKQLKNKNDSKNEHHCNQLACLVCSREENEILCFRPSTSKAPTKPGQDFFVSSNQLNSLKQNMQDVQGESKRQCKSTKLESELTNMAQDRFVHSHTPTVKIEIKNNTKEQCRTENDYGTYYAQPIAKWQVTPSIESILKCTQGPSQHKSKKNDKLNGMEKNTKIRDEQIAKRKSSKKKTEQLLDNIKLEKRKKSHKISNDQDSFFPIFESESYKNFVSTMVGSGHQPKSNELNMPKLSSKKTKNPIYSTITKTKTPSCSYSTSSASRIQPRAEGDSFQQTSTYVTFPCFTINDLFSFSLDSTEKSHLSKTAIDTYLKSLHELSSTLDDQLKLMKFALDEENLKLISHFHANSSSGYSKERSRQLYMHLVSVDKSTKQRNQDCDGVSSPRLADFSQAQYSKYDSNSQKSNSKYKVSKSTMLYVQKELSTLKSQIDQTPYLHLREEIISNKSLTDIEHKYLIKSIDEQLEKLKSIEKEIDDLIHELKHSIEGDKDYSLSNGPAEKNNCLKVESSKNEITFQERLKHIEEILQNELIRIQTALKENEELTESSSKETKNYLKITTGARKRHRERAAKDRSNAKKESFIEKFRRRFSDKTKNSLNTRKK